MSSCFVASLNTGSSSLSTSVTFLSGVSSGVLSTAVSPRLQPKEENYLTQSAKCLCSTRCLLHNYTTGNMDCLAISEHLLSEPDSLVLSQQLEDLE